MKMKIARGLLYAGVLGLAVLCMIAIIDNYELAISQGITSTISCYDTESLDIDTNKVKPIEQCDQYNPQFVFFGSIILLVIDALMFHFFNRVITQNARMGRGIEAELRHNREEDERQVENEKKKLFI